MDLALELEGVGKTYKGFALENVSFSLPRGCLDSAPSISRIIKTPNLSGAAFRLRAARASWRVT